MDDQPQALAGGLKRLAEGKFGPLSAAENLLLEKVATGDLADCSKLNDKGDDPKEADEWGPGRQVRAELLAWLCTNELARKHVHLHGIQVQGATFVGALDLSYVSIPFRLRLRHCRVREDINLHNADVPELDLLGSWVQAIYADGVIVKHEVVLAGGFSAHREVVLVGAQIGGDLICVGGTFTDPSGRAFMADGINVKGKVLLGHGFNGVGQVRFARAQIGEDFDCENGTFTNYKGSALNAGAANVRGNVFLRGKFTAGGEVSLVGAQIDGTLECAGGTFTNPSGLALSAAAINVQGSVFLNGIANAKGEWARFSARGAVILEDARVGGVLGCAGGVCVNPGAIALSANGIIVKSAVFFSSGFTAQGLVQLRDAQIGGDLSCSDGTFTNKGGDALNADGINVKGNVFLRDGFAANGEVRLLGAQIGGDLECDAGTFTNESGYALNGGGISVKGDVSLRRSSNAAGMQTPFTAKGKVNLGGAQIDGQLSCDGGLFITPRGKALSAERAVVKSSVFLSDGFAAEGTVYLEGAQIGGDLDCETGTFTNPLQKDTDGKDIEGSGYALNANGILVRGSVLLRRSTAKGRVVFLSAQIGDLACDAAHFNDDEGGEAFNAVRINARGGIFLNHGFVAIGDVWLLGAQVGGELNCGGGTFKSTSKRHYALVAYGIKVKGSVWLCQDTNLEGKIIPFSATGRVNLDTAEIDGHLDCSAGIFSNKDGDALSANRTIVKSSVFLRDGFKAEGKVNLNGAQIGGDFNCRNGNFREATLDLTDASAGTLVDSGLNDPLPPPNSPKTDWPHPGNLLLDGFTYGRISPGRINVDKRIKEWLERQPQSQFHPRPYVQLAKVLRESGDDKGAKRVLIAMEEQLRKGSIWRLPLRWTVGHGYDPLRAFWWAAGLTGIGWIIYRRSYLAGGIVPTDKDACRAFKGLPPHEAGAEGANPNSQKPAAQEPHIPKHYPSFSPLIYSLENSLPLVKLGQADKWHPDPGVELIQNRPAPKLGFRGKWRWGAEKPQEQAAAGASAIAAENPSAPSPGPVSSGGPAAASARALEPEPQAGPQPRVDAKPGSALARIAAALERSLIALGLRPPKDPNAAPSFLRRFATSPRFVMWFLWLQILLGWLLATLFVAGVSGIVHKE